MMKSWRQHMWLRRALFIAGNLAALVVVILVVVLPISDILTSRNNRIAEQRTLLARLEGIVAQESRIQAFARETETQAQTGEFLRGANDGVMTADLQIRLKSIAEGAGGRLRSVQPLPASSRDQLRLIGSRMELSGTIQVIHRTVQTIESGKPFLFVTAASLKLGPASSQPGLPPNSPQEPVIDAQLDVFGAVQPAGVAP